MDDERHGSLLKRAVRAEAEQERLASQLEAEIKQRQEELARHALVDKILSVAPVGIAFLDQNLVHRWSNRTYAGLVHSKPEELDGKTFSEIFPDRKTGKEALEDLLSSKTPRSIHFPKLLENDGKIWDFTAVPLINGHVEGVLVAIDITRQKVLEKLQLEALEQIKQLDQYKSDLMNVISHELRSPLASILGYAELLMDHLGPGADDESKKYINAITDAEERIHKIVEDLFDISSIQIGRFKVQCDDVDICCIIGEIIISMRPQCVSAGMTIECFPCDLVPMIVKGDGFRIRQILANLLSNAIKFTPAQGKVVVKAHKSEKDAVMEISDNGIGIPEEHLAFVFDKFYQVDQTLTRMRAGAGLGLHLSKLLVEAQGGRIGVISKEGSGSTFWFTLPLSETAPSQ